MGVITALVAIAVFDSLRELVPMWEFVLAIGFLLVWMLGQRYERTVVVAAGLADVDDIIEAESRSWQWFDWDSTQSDR